MASAVLTWTANAEPDVLGYKVYWGTSPGVYSSITAVGNTTTHTINGLVNNVPYYFAVTAVDQSGNESGLSAEVTITLVDITPPMPPTGVAVASA